MAAKCAHCGSINTQALADRYQCLDCGQHSGYDGAKAEPGPSQEIKDAAQAKLDRGRQVALVGNLADLQIAGGDVGPNSVGEVAKENLPGRVHPDVAAPSAAAEPEKGSTKAKK